MTEQLLIPYQAVREIPARSVLVLAPHPDDEVFGCAGAILAHVAAGVPLRVIVFTDGGCEPTTGASLQDYVARRQAECRDAARLLGYADIDFRNHADRSLAYGERLVAEIAADLAASGADLVYAPSVLEMHPDHRALGMAAVEAVRRQGQARVQALRLAFYEIGVPLQPNLLLDISAFVERKQAAMACFASQNSRQRYDLHIAALNRYRTYTLGPEVTAAEAYLLTCAAELARDPFKLYQSEHARRRELGLAVDSQDVPLVSIIIRSMDRPTLDEALDSVALQTYANIEVVLVNARGEHHRDLGQWCGRFPLRMVNQDGHALARAAAANAGLEDCRGKYVGFLDDDDTLDPDHISQLVAALQNETGPVVAYAGVRAMRRNDPERRTVRVFAEPFEDKVKLLAGNFIPFHAPLFPRRLIDAGIRLDETLELYEDWDFWLQLAQQARFVFVDRISATYFAGGTSGISAFEPNMDLVKRAYDAIYDKWRLHFTGDVMRHLTGYWHRFRELLPRHAALEVQRDALVSERDALVSERDGLVSERDALVSERDGLVNERDALVTERDALLASSSWKITRPLRALALRARLALRLVRKARNMVAEQGGMTHTAAKLWRIARNEGWRGIRLRLSRALSTGSALQLPNSDYAAWVQRYDTLTDSGRRTIRQRIAALPRRPLISVLMPTYNSRPEWLAAAIESVQRQLYPDWELCIADDASTLATLRPLLESYAAADPRIKVCFRQENGHISAASNSALALASGEWVALLDHDDLLPEQALFWVANAINQHPEVRLIYSDEDKIDEAGRRFGPYFKCDWNLDLFYSHNLITHLGVYHTDLVRAIGGFRTGLEGAQDYDLALRCIERIQPDQIHHVPRVLYHWRIHAQSTAQSASAKPYAVLAGERALNEHFQRQKIDAQAEITDYGYRVRYALPARLPLVSLIIPTRNGLQLIRQCVESILELTTYPNYEILIVDNGSDDLETLQYLETLQTKPRVRVMRDERPFNYSALNNAAAKLAHGEVIGLLNNDLEVISPEWLSEMVSIALQPGVGAVGARLWYPDDRLQHGGVVVGLGGVAGHAHKFRSKMDPGYFGRAALQQSFSAVTAACLVIRRAVFEEVGGLNETDLAVAFNDVDFCLRVRAAGYRNVWTPYAELYHHESATRGYEDTPEKQARFAKEVAYMKQRWGGQLLNDPAYSSNLTLNHEDFSLAWPPRVEPVVMTSNLTHVFTRLRLLARHLATPAALVRKVHSALRNGGVRNLMYRVRQTYSAGAPACTIPGAAHSVPPAPYLIRRDKALHSIDRKGLGLEIGPSHNPLAAKRDGFNVHILDHCSAGELREKYRNHGVALDNIEEVDFVWQGEPLHELIGQEGVYDFILASHVIEHVTDLVTFMQECSRLLKPDGVLSLVVPDKRYCFDYFRWPSSTGDVLQAYSERRTRHPAGVVFDQIAHAATCAGHIAWDARTNGQPKLLHSLDEAISGWRTALQTVDYIDAHEWRFTPSSFRLVLQDLRAMALLDLGEVCAFPTEGCEFFVSLSRSGKAGAAVPRMELLMAIDQEMRHAPGAQEPQRAA